MQFLRRNKNINAKITRRHTDMTTKHFHVESSVQYINNFHQKHDCNIEFNHVEYIYI